MDTAEDLPRMPFARNGILEVPPTLRELQREGPITRVRTQTGDVAWLVTRYDEVRALLNDQRLGRSSPGQAPAARVSGSAVFAGPRGDSRTEKADHARMRRLLAPAFTARRMRALRERIDLLVAELLDRFATLTPPADLHEHVSVPLPVLVICELLGVPYEDRAEFRALAGQVGLLNDPARAAEAYGQLIAYMRRLIARKRAEPGEDMISDLIAAADGDPSIGTSLAALFQDDPASAAAAATDAAAARADDNDDGLAELGAVLLFAGHETTVGRIDYGALLMLTHPAQRAAFMRDPGLLAGAVEEILRMSVPSNSSVLPRYAHADIEVAGTRIRTGEAVLLSASAANRDGQTFDAPDRFDITRADNPHLAFGYGVRFCVGANLARQELQAVFGALFRRFPTLELAVPAPEIRPRSDVLTGGVAELPVTW